jgi:hypothetical protein
VVYKICSIALSKSLKVFLDLLHSMIEPYSLQREEVPSYRENYLRRTKVPLPENFREKLPGFRSLSATIEYHGVFGSPGILYYKIHVLLVPIPKKAHSGFERIHSLEDSLEGGGPAEVVKAAKDLLHNEERMSEILTDYLANIADAAPAHRLCRNPLT